MIKNNVWERGACIILLTFNLSLIPGQLRAQDKRKVQTISLDEVIDLTLSNHPQLKIAKRSNEIARQDKKVAVLERLPQLSASANISYTGDASILDPGFSSRGKSDNIHFGQHMGIEAYQLIYSGNRIKKTVESKDLVLQLTQLDLQASQQEIKLLISSHYITLYNLENQENVYIQNIELARSRKKQINSLYRQGMITNDDVIRAELQLSGLLLEKEQIQTQMEIVQNQLLLATGLKVKTLQTDSLFLNKSLGPLLSERDYIEHANNFSPRLKRVERERTLQEKNLEIVKTEKSPTVYAFSSNNLDRPLRSVLPQQDLYANVWMIGVGLKYNISGLYTLGRKTRLQQLNIRKAQDVLNYEKLVLEQNISDYIKMEKLAWSQWHTFTKNESLANENYRITEKKYFNQLALFIDLFNASNLKLEAELKSATAHAEAVYAHFRLLGTVGVL